ncbi:MAG: hypothetical protein ACI9MB_002886, partial [Verrucomicrobiales bacterium]
REAYSDAQDSTITVTDDDGLASVASFTHAFQNFEASLLHEELALLRGTDFGKSYPVNNRLFWNYAKGLGEAAYNVNYNIYDENTDGFINEDDARALYPQGHGDAWGHFVSALGMHYELLQQPVFSWKTRSELYALMENVLEVDFLDEKTFASIAAAKARAGRDIVRGTYRLNYTNDPDGQWQGYTDGADPARAWGVSEWSHRAGFGAYVDWAVANAILPEEADAATPIENPENLDRLERSAAKDEIGEVAGGLYEIQMAMDEVNGGSNPLGLDSDAITFDIDPYFDGSGWERETYFGQIYSRAVTAGNNALTTLQFATKAENKIRRIADDTDALIVEALRQDIDYRNRLIEIFGRPYDGTIGFGKAYPEGYEGPDTILSAYLDRTSIERIIPATSDDAPADLVTFNVPYYQVLDAQMDNSTLTTLFNDVYGGEVVDVHGENGNRLALAYRTLVGNGPYEQFEETRGLDLPVRRASDYAFEAPSEWGQRTSYGAIQRALEEMLAAEIEYSGELIDYFGYIQDWEVKNQRFINEIDLFDDSEDIRDKIDEIRKGVNGALVAVKAAIKLLQTLNDFTDDVAKAASSAAPTSVGFSNDFGSPVRAVALSVLTAGRQPLNVAQSLAEVGELIAEIARDEAIADRERDLTRIEQVSEIEGLLEDLVNLSGADGPRRHALGLKLQNLEIKRQEYFTAQAEGFRLLREREAFNKILAASVQKNRYQDMLIRLSRNEAMSKYQSSFNHAARYAWLTARAYDYEASLDSGDAAAPGAILDQIVKERQLGLWVDGQPQAGQGGLGEILNHLGANFQVLEGQLGINNPQAETGKISMRSELFRIGAGVSDGGNASSDDRWEDALKARIEPDLTTMPEFRRYCRPFSTPEEGPQPGLVIRFSSQINNGVNFFGNALAPGDHAYSTANYATKIRSFGVSLENYNLANLSTTPRAYMVPVGTDFLRTSNTAEQQIRAFGVVEQRIPAPYVINQSDLTKPSFIPSLDGVDGSFAELRRHGDFRMYHDSGAVEESELVPDSRLISRSVWNSDWLLIIPGAGLHADPITGLTQFAENISDIKLHFVTYSHQGQ